MAVSVALAAYVAVRFALWPLDALGARVSGLEVQSLRPIPSRGLPAETRPLVRAINGLMRRLRLTFRAREAFINDTAHQLRTPLAALSAQVDLLGQLDLSPDLRRRVGDVAGSVQRLVHLANQLLALARADEQASAVTRMQTVDLPELLQEVASACLDTALEKGVDLGFEPAPANVTGAPALLLEMLKNLVDNAIVHSPAGTTVTVRCGTVEGLEETYLEVEDDGPGIAAADRSRVFDRYVRLKPGKAPGTGLGLAIVREIALRHGAEVQIQDGAGGRGTRVRVSFGATRQPPPM
jgi:two-component system sensor histidine kinase TctE